MKRGRILRWIGIGMLVVAVIFIACALSNPALGSVFTIGGIEIGPDVWRVFYACYAIVMAALFAASFFVGDGAKADRSGAWKLLIGYAIPFSFLAMYGDVTFDSMWLYGLLIVGFGLLCWGSIRCRSWLSLVLGNILSGCISALCVAVFQTPEWSWYFKPLPAMGLMLLISAAAFVIQLIVWLLANQRRKAEP